MLLKALAYIWSQDNKRCLCTGIFCGSIRDVYVIRFFSGMLGAFFFSAFHFQFEGLFPRTVLGAVLGYLYYWSNNLWVPIILHFFNNAIIISAPYFAISDTVAATEQEMGWEMMLTVVGAGLIGYFLIKSRPLFFNNQQPIV